MYKEDLKFPRIILKIILNGYTSLKSGFGGLVVSMLASGTQVCGFEAVGFFG
jgi:hypothetical protein